MAQLETREDGLYVDGKRVLKGWETVTGWYHFALEDLGDAEVMLDRERSATGRQYFGFVQGFEEEFGEFNTAEFEKLIREGKMWQIRSEDLPYAGRRS